MAPVAPAPTSSAVLGASVDRAAAAVESLRDGELIVVARGGDDIGELVATGASLSDDAADFMATHGGGIIYVALPEARCDALGLAPQSSSREARAWEADLRVSIDAREGISTGISAADRARTVRVASDPAYSSEDLVCPGHIVPFATRTGGVLERADLGEAGVDLCRVAGLPPATADCEILNADGTRAAGADLPVFARRHGLTFVEIVDVVKYMAARTRLLRDPTSHSVATAAGDADLHVFREASSGRARWALDAGAGREGGEAHVAVSPPCAGGRLLGTCRACAEATAAVLGQLRRLDRAVVVAGERPAPHCEVAPVGIAPGEHGPRWLELALTAQMLQAIGVRRLRAVAGAADELAGLDAFDVRWVG